MKKIQIKSLLIVLLSGMIMASAGCKKDEDKSLSKTDMLTGGNWKMSAMTISPGINLFGQVITDLFANDLFMPACSKDDFVKFNTNGTAVFDEGATKCDAGDPQSTSGTWAFNSDQTKITVTESGDSSEYNISELSSSKLKMTYSLTEDFGNGEQTYTYTITFTR